MAICSSCQGKINAYSSLRSKLSSVQSSVTPCITSASLISHSLTEKVIINGSSIDNGKIGEVASSVASVVGLLGAMCAECGEWIEKYQACGHDEEDE